MISICRNAKAEHDSPQILDQKVAVALDKWLWHETCVLKVVGSNSSTVYWMDIFLNILFLNCT